MKLYIKYSPLIFSLFLFGSLVAQNKKMESSVELTFCRKADLSNTASVRATAKNDSGKRVPAKNAHINFYFKNGANSIPAGTEYTDRLGKTTITLPNNLPIDTGGYFDIVAKIENDNMYGDADDEVHLKKADLTVTLNSQDTGKVAYAKVTVADKNGDKKPVKDITVGFDVQRLFGFMPAAEDYTVTTDENGVASFKYPKDIPGDTLGNIIVTARITDNDLLGNMEANTNAQWGVPNKIPKNPFPRAMWEPRAPAPLVITISVLYGGVWLIYFFTFSQMRLISKANKKKKKEQL